ncbi:MAG: hypothetical protein KJ720_10035 [Proteobacteria bacterium]|nr:hypothetical protein [Pseudomonadota bacterium]MBU1452428.1 hypothetical protein [Pseudomonadota bacterium]MBU2467695.1 hypothetical protein [Pseudomonadota bacterium]MBU2518247.1 hypothetical protein [Pseudomonadota bacterium]
MNPTPQDICGISREDYLVRMEEFHGHVSPGTVMGGFLLDAAWKILGDTPYINVVVETVVCLPDSVQMLTPCTLGNGFLQVLDWGKFALTIYDRMTLDGARAWLGTEDIEQYPLVADWYLRRAGGKKADKLEVVDEIMAGGHRLVRARPVRMHAPLKDTAHVPTVACPACGEYYPSRQGGLCPACAGQAYYS